MSIGHLVIQTALVRGGCDSLQLDRSLTSRRAARMPDALRFIGVTKVDRLLSMSKDKYDALVGADIEIVNRISLPESWVPANATVEISAKIAAGYNSFQPELKTDLGSADYLWSLDAVRERSRSLLDIGLRGGLPHFEIDMSRMSSAVDAVLGTVSKRVRRVFPPFVGSVGTFGLFDLTWHCLNLPKWIDVQYPSMKVPVRTAAAAAGGASLLLLLLLPTSCHHRPLRHLRAPKVLVAAQIHDCASLVFVICQRRES